MRRMTKTPRAPSPRYHNTPADRLETERRSVKNLRVQDTPAEQFLQGALGGLTASTAPLRVKSTAVRGSLSRRTQNEPVRKDEQREHKEHFPVVGRLRERRAKVGCYIARSGRINHKQHVMRCRPAERRRRDEHDADGNKSYGERPSPHMRSVYRKRGWRARQCSGTALHPAAAGRAFRRASRQCFYFSGDLPVTRCAG